MVWEDGAKQSAVVGQKDRLDHIQISLCLNIVVIANTAHTKCQVIFVNDTDHALLKALYRVGPPGSAVSSSAGGGPDKAYCHVDCAWEGSPVM